jgi:hypothetical protein
MCSLDAADCMIAIPYAQNHIELWGVIFYIYLSFGQEVKWFQPPATGATKLRLVETQSGKFNKQDIVHFLVSPCLSFLYAY